MAILQVDKKQCITCVQFFPEKNIKVVLFGIIAIVFMIRANTYVPYRDFMAVLNTLQSGGYLKIGLISEDL